eukprot:TRINITY_DN5773_c0_g1_i2.p2 TRINITY_DN5773_c0_g1~~TRINITY_DN5773_c0_g1_i2.p2  ORF type:complete len:153 (+),score=52.01 TRINITY_DN5773_c0_g1_i2:176-634(+)
MCWSESDRLVSGSLLAFFDSAYEPTVGMADYARRLQRGSGGDDVEAGVTAALACLLLQRALTRQFGDGRAWVTPLNAHRLLLAATVVALKLLRDRPSKRLMYELARQGGVPTRELAQLEAAMLFLLAFELYVPSEEFSTFCDEHTARLSLAF